MSKLTRKIANYFYMNFIAIYDLIRSSCTENGTARTVCEVWLVHTWLLVGLDTECGVVFVSGTRRFGRMTRAFGTKLEIDGILGV